MRKPTAPFAHTPFARARLLLGLALCLTGACVDDSDSDSDASSEGSSGDEPSTGSGSETGTTTATATGSTSTSDTDATTTDPSSTGIAPFCGDGMVDPATEECDPAADRYDFDCTDCEITTQGCSPFAPLRCTNAGDGCIFDGQLFACEANGTAALNEPCDVNQDCVAGNACLGAPSTCRALCDREPDSPFGECDEGTCMEVIGGVPGMPYIGVCDG